MSWQEKVNLAKAVVEKKRASDRLKLEAFHRSTLYKIMVPLRVVLLIYILSVYFSPVIPFLDYKDRVTGTSWYTHRTRGKSYSERMITFEKAGTLGFRTGYAPDIVFSLGDEALIQRNILFKPASVYNPRTQMYYTPNGKMEMVVYFGIVGFCLLVTFFYRDAASIAFNKIVLGVNLLACLFYQLFI